MSLGDWRVVERVWQCWDVGRVVWQVCGFFGELLGELASLWASFTANLEGCWASGWASLATCLKLHRFVKAAIFISCGELRA